MKLPKVIKLRFILLQLLVFVSFSLKAQTDNGFIDFKTPEASAFNRNIEVPVSLYSGVPSINIPLYEITIKGVSVPISLNYHAGGIRVDQESTWVGLGWDLSFGGQISRKTRSLPDEEAYFLGGSINSLSIDYFNQLPAPTSMEAAMERAGCLFDAKDGRDKDYMPDEFYYQALNYSGRFMFNQQGNKFVIFPKEDITVKPISSTPNPPFYYSYPFYTWNLKLPDGTNVDFGQDGIISKRNSSGIGDTKSNWQIKKIRNVYNDSITYEYETFNYNALKITGVTYSYQNGPDYANNGYKWVNEYFYDSRITKINFPNGTISFFTSDRTDMPTKALYQIIVKDNNGTPIKIITFNYSYFYGSSFDNNIFTGNIPGNYRYNRLRLDGITIKDINNNSYSYSFDYYNNPNMPSKFSFAQDHWGYYNGIANTGVYSFIPNLASPYFTGGDRRVKPENSNVFALKSITYPEGGKTEFTYENNTSGIENIPNPLIDTYQDDNIIDTNIVLYISSYSRKSDFPDPDYTDASGNRYFKKTFTISPESYPFIGMGWNCYTNFGISDGEKNMPDYANNVIFRLEKLNSNGKQLIKEFKNTSGGPNYTRTESNNNALILSPGNYEMTVILTYLNPEDVLIPYNLTFNIQWRELNPLTKMVYTGGLRIKHIKFFDTDGSIVKQKTYQYINPAIYSSIPDYTSGKCISFPKYYQYKSKYLDPRIYYNERNEPVISYGSMQWGIHFSSYSTLPLETTGGSYSGYTHVDEIDVDFNNPANNLKTSYEFSFTLPYFSQYYGYQRYGIIEPSEWTRGKLLSKTYFKNDFIQRKEEYHYYDWSPHLTNLGGEDFVQEINTDLISYQLLKRYCVSESNPEDFYDNAPSSIDYNDFINFHNGSTNHNDNSYKGFHCPEYYYGFYDMTLHLFFPDFLSCQEAVRLPYFLHYTGFDKLKSKTITDYYGNNKNVSIAENYYYEKTPQLYQISKVESNNSKQETEQKLYKYPIDFSSIAPYNIMLQKGILNPVIETINNKNSSFIESTKTNYKDWGNNIIAPFTTEGKVGNNDANVLLRFHSYDNKGNVLSISKENDVLISYIWGYNNTLPVVKIEGISNDDLQNQYGSIVSFIHNNSNLPFSTDYTTVSAKVATLKNQLVSLINNPAYMVTFYTYSPLVGMTSQTDPNGFSTYFEYDGFGRMIRLRDKNANIIKEIKYNYKGQQE